MLLRNIKTTEFCKVYYKSANANWQTGLIVMKICQIFINTVKKRGKTPKSHASQYTNNLKKIMFVEKVKSN